jgi:hypothetical protein
MPLIHSSQSLLKNLSEKYSKSPFIQPLDPNGVARKQATKRSIDSLAQQRHREKGLLPEPGLSECKALVSATDGVKRAILSGTIRTDDGTINKHMASAQTELAGLTSWSSVDLAIKYRGEVEREAAWRAYMEALKASEDLQQSAHAFFATAVIARHPLYVMVERLVGEENERSQIRARKRASLRRFVLDVHQVVPRSSRGRALSRRRA